VEVFDVIGSAVRGGGFSGTIGQVVS
jgi:hypothetical protein